MESKSQGIKHRWKIALFSLIMISLVLLVPNTIIELTGMNAEHRGAIGIKSNNPTWYNSTVTFSDADGHREVLVFHYLPDVSTARVEPQKVFVHETECTIVFRCPDLNLTLGPYSFVSNEDTLLYLDYSSGSQIMWNVRNDQ